jgi:hypothetical protein
MRIAPLHAACRLAALGFALSAAVSVAAADDRGICSATPPKSATILACSRIIASSRTSPHDRALALSFRAAAKRTQGDAAGADADIEAAKALDPTVAGKP